MKLHGLIQAFSRTNRILNSVKTFGNIVCFRDLEQETNEALALFGNKEARGIVLLKSYKEYIDGFVDEEGRQTVGYNELIEKLKTEFPLDAEIIGEEAELEFIRIYGAILRLRNTLSCFDEFQDDESLSERELQDYQSNYIDLYQAHKKKTDKEKEKINTDIVFEIELIKQVDITIDYILLLVKKYADSNCKDKTILVNIEKSINSSIELRSKKQLIEDFLSEINVSSDIDNEWKNFVQAQKSQELQNIINEEKLKEQYTVKFIDNSLRDGSLKTTGLDIDNILPPVSRFSSNTSDGNRAEKKQRVIDRLLVFFEKYFGLM